MKQPGVQSLAALYATAIQQGRAQTIGANALGGTLGIQTDGTLPFTDLTNATVCSLTRRYGHLDLQAEQW